MDPKVEGPRGRGAPQKAEEECRERERLIKERQDRIDRLLHEATALRQATDLRSYVETVLARSLPASEPGTQESIRRWAAWALGEADRIDPIKSQQFMATLPATERC